MANNGYSDHGKDANKYPNESMSIYEGYDHRQTYYNLESAIPDLVPQGTNQKSKELKCDPSTNVAAQNFNEWIDTSIHAITSTNFVQGYSGDFYETFNYQQHKSYDQFNGHHQQQYRYNGYPNNAQINNKMAYPHLPVQLNANQQAIVQPKPFKNIPDQSNIYNPEIGTSTVQQHLSLQYPSENVTIPSLSSLAISSSNTETTESSENSDDSCDSLPYTQTKKRGRPKIHKTETKRKAAKNAAQKRYEKKKQLKINILKNEVLTLKHQNTEFKSNKEASLKTCKKMLSDLELPEFDRNLITGALLDLE